MDAREIHAQVWRLYVGCPWWRRWMALARTLICPFDKVLAFAPVQGRFVEIGCGTGICANLLALGSPQRTVAGYDLNPRVIATATATVGNRPNITFQVGDVRDVVGRESADVVVAVDLFHHLEVDVQADLVAQVYRRLGPGGLFLLKEVERRPRWKYCANYLHDALMARGNPHIHVRSRADYGRLLAASGFAVEIVPMPQAYLAHVLYVCRR